MKQNSVVTNMSQNFTSSEKEQGRNNIDAMSEQALLFSNVIGGIDLSTASATIDMQRVQVPNAMTYYSMRLTNANGNTKEFSLIPSDASGYLYANGNGSLSFAELPQPRQSDIMVYNYTVSDNDVTFSPDTLGYTELHLTTPNDYNGPATYSAHIGDMNWALTSGAWYRFVFQYNDSQPSVQKWWFADSGYIHR